MNLVLLVIAAVAAVNAPRARAALPPDDRVPVAAIGALIALAAAAGLAALADHLAEAVDLAPPTVRMAAGAVMAAQGLAGMVLPFPTPEPRLAGRNAALLPVAFPALLTPALGLLAVSASLDRSAPTAIAALAVGLATLPALAVGWPRPPSAAARALGALLAAVLVVAGVALVSDGIFDI